MMECRKYFCMQYHYMDKFVFIEHISNVKLVCTVHWGQSFFFLVQCIDDKGSETKGLLK